MIFVKTEDLKAGMRLAKPIYSRTGVLLYERNSLLTPPGIRSVKSFELFGVYILEPAEPVPPLTKEDLEFEQKQTVYMFQLRDCYDEIKGNKKLESLDGIVKDINKCYGKLNHRINFNQNLRSVEDYGMKHAISVAILVALLCSHFDMDENTKHSMIAAALLYNYGWRFIPRPILMKGSNLDEGDKDVVQQSEENGLDCLSQYRERIPFFKKAYAIMQFHIYENNEAKRLKNPDPSFLFLNSVLTTAIKFDQATGMRMGQKPESEIMAMRHFADNRELYDDEVISALAKSIHIVPAGASVDLSTGDKGIVLVENPVNFMRPLILRISNNQLYDLSSDTIFKHMQIVDIMKTMDNRIAIDEDTLKLFKADARIKETTERLRRGLYN